MDGEKFEEKPQPPKDEPEQQQEGIPPVTKNRLLLRVRKLNQFLSDYKALLTFITAILTVVYVQLAFGLDPLESYRSTSTTKKLSEFYREMGDMLVYNSQHADAETAYKAALSLQPNNTRASYGLAKAQIFTPSGGRKYTDTETVSIKLDYLLSQFPDDADLYFLKCVNAEGADDSAAKVWCEKAISIDGTLYAAYITLGYICGKEFDVDCSIRNFKKALELNPESQTANNNLGFCELLQLNLTDAAKHLEKANSISAGLETSLTLGEVYRYSGDVPKAIAMHKYCLSTASEKDIDKESFAEGNWIINFLPHEKNDTEIIKLYAMAPSIELKKTMVHYALAIDYALLQDFKSASREFESGRNLDSDNQLGDYFVNRCFSATKILSASAATKSWFRKTNKKVCSSKEVCGEIDSLYL